MDSEEETQDNRNGLGLNVFQSQFVKHFSQKTNIKSNVEIIKTNNIIQGQIENGKYKKRTKFAKDTPIIIDSNNCMLTFKPKCHKHHEHAEEGQQLDDGDEDCKLNLYKSKVSDASTTSSQLKEHQMKHTALEKIQDLYSKAANSDFKFDSEKFLWEVMKEFRQNSLTYKCLKDIQPYKFKGEDMHGNFKMQAQQCKKFFDKKINDSDSEHPQGAKINVLSHYEVNQITGEKFLRLTLRQWKTNYDPEMVDNKKRNTSNMSTSVNQIRYEIHSIKFLKFDEVLQSFEVEDEILYDISNNLLNVEAGSFNNDFFLTKNECTYFYQKNIENSTFELWKHSYGTPFQKFPIDNNPFPMHEKVIMEDIPPIQLPKGFKLDDVQINFMKNVSSDYSLRKDQLQEENRFLDNQYIFLREKIYKTSDNQDEDGMNMNLAIFKVSNGEMLYNSYDDKDLDRQFQDIQCGFFMEDNYNSDSDSNIQFILKSKKRDYNIRRHCRHSFQVLFERSLKFLRYKQHMIVPKNIEIFLERTEEKFEQSFFLTKKNSQVNFIYPIHSQRDINISQEICSKQEEVSNNIYRQILHNERGKIGYQDIGFTFMVNEKFQENILYDLNQKTGFKQDDEYITTEDLILKVNLNDNTIHYWVLQPTYEFTCYRETMMKLQDDRSQMLQRIILQQFNIDNRRKSGNNYNMIETLGYYQNQFLNKIYLTTRDGIYLEHHKVYLKEDEPLELPNNLIIMDLDVDQGQLQMIPLYNPSLYQNGKCDLKLESYHISFEHGLVAFFFSQRNRDKTSNIYAAQISQSGVNFMVCHKISNLLNISNIKKNQKSSMSAIIDKDCPVFIFGSNVHQIIYTNYDRETIMQYQDNSKAASMMASTLVHEMVFDPLNPFDFLVPFLFSSEVCRKPTPIFQWYFCFMNLIKVQDFIEQNFLQQNKKIVLQLNDLCDLYLLREVANPIKISTVEDTKYENNKIRDCPLFCRSSPFSFKSEEQKKTKDDEGNDLEDTTVDDKTCMAKFQIGFVMNPMDKQIFEITEYLVTYKIDPVFRNLDLYQIFNKKLSEIKSQTKIEAYQMQHILPSAAANEKFIGQKKYWENHRLIPKIDNDGMISGTYLMLNLYMIYRDKITITSDISLIEQQEKNLGIDFEIIKRNAGCEIKFINPTSPYKGLIFMENGLQIELPLLLLQDENGESVTAHIEPEPEFIYQIICTSDGENDPFLQQKTPIMQVGYKNYAFDGQPACQVCLVTSRLNEETINSQMFNNHTSLNLLLDQQKILMTTSIPSLKEIYKTKFNVQAKCYFQFRFLLLGRSFCSIDYPSFNNSITKLMQAVNECEIQYNLITEDSALKKMFDSSTSQLELDNAETLKGIFEMFQIHPRNQFTANWNFETFVQKSLDHNLNRPLIFLMEHILNECDESIFKKTLIQDLPQLLIQDQANISNFLTEYVPNEQDMQGLNGESKLDGCRLETPIQNPDLPLVGENLLKSTLVENFISYYDMQQEILTHILKEFEKSETQRYHFMQELMMKNQQIPQEEHIEIQHTQIDFIPLINKLKVDIFMGRKANTISYTQYLEFFADKKPAQIDSIDDLFLAELFNYQVSNLDFFKNKSIQKIIARQFEYTQDFIHTLLWIYTFGFVIPLLVIIYINTQHIQMNLDNTHIVVQMTMYVIGGMTQVFFLTLEYAEVRYSGVGNYFKDGFNYMDSTQYIFFACSIYFKWVNVHKQVFNEERFYYEMCQIIIVIQSAMKFLQLIRYNESFCSLVEMLLQVSKDIYPFLIVFFTFCGIFSIVTLILEGGYSEEAYPLMDPLSINILQTFRNSIGDLLEPRYGKWIPIGTEQVESREQVYIMIVTWFFFIANIFIMQIVLLNFLIAEVSMTYERVNQMGPCLLFQKKQELNFMVQKYLWFYGKKDPFKALIMISPKNLVGEEDDFSDLKTFMKDQMKFEIQKLQMEILPNIKKINESCQSNNKFVSDTEVQIKSMQNQMDKMNDSIKALDQKSDKIYQFLEQMDKKTQEN